jgi:GTP-binding protein
MFIDSAQVTVKAGDGGPGVVSFRHEKYVDKGGPDGGDGGDGGNVVFQATNNQHTLAQFRFQKLLKAKDGSSGGKRKKRGKGGEDLVVSVPVGTSIIAQAGQSLIADMTQDGQIVIIAEGGKGGFGNAHFTTSTRQAPRIAEKGEPGDEVTATLELKMIADVGLIGLPNAGKSTLLATISNAKPEVADYPFTTIQPYLGVVDVAGSSSLLFADIPGLIAGASEGKGLGDDFLRHVERTSVLLHLIDAYQDDVVSAYQTIMQELRSYRVDLTQKPQIIALTKVENLDDEMLQDTIKQLKKVAGKSVDICAISAHSKQGITALLHDISQHVRQHKEQLAQEVSEDIDEKKPLITLPVQDSDWHIEKTKKAYIVHGKKLTRFAHRTDFDSDQAVARYRDILRKTGVMHELVRQGIEPGDTIKIAGTEAMLEY